MTKSRSVRGVLQLDIDVKRWMAEVPPVETCRPARCASCGVASRPVGGSLKLHGHGLVARQFWGPRGPSDDEVSEIAAIFLRRFLCVGCGAVTTVGPAGMLHRKWYHGTAIAFALALWTLDLLSIGAVRERVSPWRHQGWSVKGRWASLKRWAAEMIDGRLWAVLERAAAERETRAAIADGLVRLAARVLPPTLGAVDSPAVFFAAAQSRGWPSMG